MFGQCRNDGMIGQMNGDSNMVGAVCNDGAIGVSHER